MKKLNFLLIFFSLLAWQTRAENPVPKIAIHPSGVYLSGFSTSELQNLYDEIGFDAYINPPGNEYPRFFLKNLPSDFPALNDKTYRNQVFIKILTPLALKINQEILAEKEGLNLIEFGLAENGDLDPVECAYIEELAVKYDAVTPFKDSRRCMKLLKELLRRVDAVPPSILVAAAAIHSNWGTSRTALAANNLYQARDWYTDKGLASLEEPEEPYRFKIFPSLEQSMREYALKINSDVNYEQFWNARRTARLRPDPLYGKRLDWALVLDSNLPNYAGLLDYTLTYYRFYYLDEAVLEEEYEFVD